MPLRAEMLGPFRRGARQAPKEHRKLLLKQQGVYDLPNSVELEGT